MPVMSVTTTTITQHIDTNVMWYVRNRVFTECTDKPLSISVINNSEYRISTVNLLLDICLINKDLFNVLVFNVMALSVIEGFRIFYFITIAVHPIFTNIFQVFQSHKLSWFGEKGVHYSLRTYTTQFHIREFWKF